MTSLTLLLALTITAPAESPSSPAAAQGEYEVQWLADGERIDAPPAVKQGLEDGVLSGPPMPKGCEWLPELVHREVERSTQPLREAMQRLRAWSSGRPWY